MEGSPKNEHFVNNTCVTWSKPIWLFLRGTQDGFKMTNKWCQNLIFWQTMTMINIDIILSFDYEVLKETHHNTADQ